MTRLCCLLVPVLLFTITHAHAAKLPPLDKAWTEHCVALRKASKHLAGTVRNYCVCMQELVGARETFETATDMERIYPAAHRSCRRKAGLRPG